MQLTINDVFKRFGSVEALRGTSFDAEPGEFFALLGPSGAGKTTLLRIIAGIEQADRGRVLLDGRDVADIPVRARDTAMVFQTFALYPHLSTFENLAYPLREARVGSNEIKKRVGEIAEMLRLSHALSRKPSTLSGGRAAALRDRPGADTPAEAAAARRTADQSRRQAAARHARRIQAAASRIARHDDNLCDARSDRGAEHGAADRGAQGGSHRPGRRATDAVHGAARRVCRVAGWRSADQPDRGDAEGRRRQSNSQRCRSSSIDAAPWKTSLSQFPSGAKFMVGVRPQAIAPVADAAETGSGSRGFRRASFSPSRSATSRF